MSKHKYNKLRSREKYDRVLASGMFFEFHPELTGVWIKDKIYIKHALKQTNKPLPVKEVPKVTVLETVKKFFKGKKK